jgi:hypothetical protein
MRFLLIILTFISSARSETTQEAYRRLFPNGIIVLQLRPEIEGGNRLLLKPIRLVNEWSPSLDNQYIYYEVFFAKKSRGKLIITASYFGREYAVFGSRVFLSEKDNTDFKVKYIVSNDLRIVSRRNMTFLALARPEKPAAELLVQPFLSCNSAL